MIPCSHCQRHHRVSDTVCPFCGATEDVLPRGPNRFAAAAFIALSPVLLAACYGGAPKVECDTADTACETTTSTATDEDDDGFTVVDDCDDADAAVNPGATEVCDDTLDNDCDQATDTEDTDCATQ